MNYSSLLDIFGTIASFLATYYFIRIDYKAWVLSFLATMLNGILYWQQGIYADMALEMAYWVSTCLGWYNWSQRKGVEQVIKPGLKKGQSLALLMTVLVLFKLIKLLLLQYTSSTVANLDAITTDLSLVAQGLMCYKIRTTWLLWLIADSLYAYLYLSKSLPFHAGLMVVYTFMAGIGYYQWSKHLNQPQPV